MQLINDYKSRLDDLINRGYSLNIEAAVRKGIDIFRKAPELFIVYTILFIAIMPFGGFIISGPLTGGFLIVSHKISRNQPVRFENFLDGFQIFVPLFLVVIVTGILCFFGYLFFIIPGIYLSVCYTFALHFAVFEKLEFWDAMEASRKLVHREWFSIFALVIVLAIINIAGVLFFGIGILVTIPVSTAALYAAFEDIYLNNSL